MIFLVFTILFLLITLGIFAFSIYKAVKVIKNPMPGAINYPLEIKKLGFLTLGSAISLVVTFIFLAKQAFWVLDAGEWVELVFGSFLFAACLETFVLTFIIHYYGKEIPLTLNKVLFWVMVSSVVVSILSLMLLTNSFADDLRYPLVNAINIPEGPLTPSPYEHGGLSIAFYALFILGGALIVYFICDHRFYQEYGEHGILESLFFVAFPAGIIGARIGYVIGNWNGDLGTGETFAERVANGEWWAPLAIWEGGLTIISGALVGAVVGILWFGLRKKKYSLLLAMDVIIPAILIAQAVGRIGNFFNCEVYGTSYPVEYFNWLPKIIVNNMNFSPKGEVGDPGMIHLPLFLIELITNLIGYFVIRYAFGRGLKKYIEMGDLAALYFVWYGYTRMALEPLRDATFKMGTKGYWSWFWAFFFILAGALAIAINHIVRYILSKKKNTYILLKDSFRNGLIASGSILLPSLALIITGSILMSQSEHLEILAFNDFNNGLIILISGISLLLMLSVTLPYVLEGSRGHEKQKI